MTKVRETKTWRVARYRIALVRESSVPTTWDRQVRHPEDVVRLLTPLLADLDREVFVVVMLDTRRKVAGINLASIGSLNMALVHPREVFKPAILTNAESIIVAHNHPSGDSTPSPEDRALTARLIAAGQTLGIAVLDSLVLTATGAWASAGGSLS